MGDLNDNPTDPSMVKILKCVDKKKNAKGGLFNPCRFYKKELASLGYNDTWSLFDQQVISLQDGCQKSKRLFLSRSNIYLVKIL